jgi:glutamine synthetase
LKRIAEDYNVNISFEPKLFTDWAGSGGHINYSTEKSRTADCSTVMALLETDFISKLEKKHSLHLNYYGDNTLRLSGKFETSSKDKFTYGIGNRDASIRIPS